VNYFYKKSHVHVITSMGEGNPTVLWEAMSFGIPTITLDHSGMHDTVCERCGIKIPSQGSLQTVIEYLTKTIDELIEFPQKIEQLSDGVQHCTPQFSWARRRADWAKYYDTAIINWKLRGGGQ
jgi:glycosyltransferase involved in cell wall biosynthesis